MSLLSDCTCSDHPEGAVFYVTALNDRGQYARLSGPHATHQAAIDIAPTVIRWADGVDPRAPWYRYGTCAIQTTTPTLGAYERLVLVKSA